MEYRKIKAVLEEIQKMIDENENTDEIDKGVSIGLEMAKSCISEITGVKIEKERPPITAVEAVRTLQWISDHSFLYTSSENNIKESCRMAILAITKQFVEELKAKDKEILDEEELFD